MKEEYKNIKAILLPGVLNSYSVLFFFNSRLLAVVLMVITFFNFFAGLSGLIAVVATVLIADSMGFDKVKIKQGIYSFNALLTGIGIGTFFEPGVVFFVLLLIATLFAFILSVILSGWLGKYGLPFLSIPFVVSFWLIILPSGQFANLGLTQRNVFWMNELYSVGGKHLLDFFQTIDSLPLNKMVIVYFRSLSSILFQDNLLSGILMAAALLISSRIAFLLSVAGFITAYLFAHLIGSDMASFSFYNIGANYILVSIAVGGFFTIPSRYSFLWVFILVPLTSVMILFTSKLTTNFNLPFFSLPFSITVISFIYFLILRVKPGKLVLTPIQHFSPEVNLYSYQSSIGRTTGMQYFPLHLPFWGAWMVSQGYEGDYTHKGEWSNAIDFVLVDELNSTHGEAQTSCEDYYCYNKPVTAPADGVVMEIVDFIDDNEPGKVNSGQNWGNTIIIKHLNDLYTQISHLKAGSFKVKPGDFVRLGEVLATCGNSGRSPEPHLHFQVQLTPRLGAKTFPYPFAYYLASKGNKKELSQFTTPAEGAIISNVSTHSLLKNAFDYQPGMLVKYHYHSDKGKDALCSWEVFADSYNNKYFYCKESQSTAYFVNDSTAFYFTAFYGDHQSLLYIFYLTAYKVLLGYHENIEISDFFPLHSIRKNRFSLWINDLVAPFYQLLKAHYRIRPVSSDSPVNPSQIRYSTSIDIEYFQLKKEEATGTIYLADDRIKEFSYESNHQKIWAQRIEVY